MRLNLGAGESEAIALALEIPDTIVILDDHQARQTARAMEVELTGTVGVLLKCKKTGVIDSVRPVLDNLRSAGFWMSDTLYQHALELAKE